MINRSLCLSLLYTFLLFAVSYKTIAQTDTQPIYSSPQTQMIIKHAQLPNLGENEFSRFLNGLEESLEKIESIYQSQIDPGGFRKKFIDQDSWIDGAAEGIVGDIPFLGGALNGVKEYREKEYSEEIQPFITERLFGQTSSLNTYFSHIREACYGDIGCIEEAAKEVSENPRIRELLSQNPGLIEQAKLKELIAASSANADENHQQTLGEFASQQEFTAAMAASVHEQLSQILANGETLINNTATIIQTQQEHTIALSQIQATIDANQEELRRRLNQGFGEVISLQKQNIFLTEMVLEHTAEIGQKIDIVLVDLENIGENINKIRETQLKQIFNSSPLIQRLRMLEGEEGKELISDEAKRRAMIENVKIMMRQEQLIAVTKKVREWGVVTLEALNVFYPNCPPEIKRVVSVAITASDIIGSITAGNWSQAILSGLSLFKSPKPGPEMQMLQRISEQLTSLESNMNAQFREMHEHLFAMEENLTRRLEIIDQKLDIISSQIQFAYTELSEELLSANNKLSYIIKQNDCTKDLILDIFRSSSIDICEGPVSIFKDRMSKGLINSWEDLEEFFIGQQCQSCIEALFTSSNQNLLNSPLFNYSYCNIASATDNNRPDYIYNFVFNTLLADSIKSNPIGLFSILSLPSNISTAAVLMDSIRAKPDSVRQKISDAYSSFVVTESDQHYRHYMAVLEMADYALTMMPFLELYNDGSLLTYEQIASRPEITRERSRKLIGFMDNLSELIDHTIFQQSLMTGLTAFKTLDRFMEFGDGEYADVAGMTLTDLFTYNPLFNKNYSAYFLEKKFGGFKNLSRIVKSDPLRTTGKYYQGNNQYESLILKDQYNNLTLSTNWSTGLGKKPIFQSYMPDITGAATDTLLYSSNLFSAIPQSLPALLNAKNQINRLSSEMRFVISDELDKPNAPLTRKELDTILQVYKTR